MNNLPKVVTQQRRGRGSNPRLLDRKSDALPLSHRAMAKNRAAGFFNSQCNILSTVSVFVPSLYVYIFVFINLSLCSLLINICIAVCIETITIWITGRKVRRSVIF